MIIPMGFALQYVSYAVLTAVDDVESELATSSDTIPSSKIHGVSFPASSDPSQLYFYFYFYSLNDLCMIPSPHWRLSLNVLYISPWCAVLPLLSFPFVDVTSAHNDDPGFLGCLAL